MKHCGEAEFSNLSVEIWQIESPKKDFSLIGYFIDNFRSTTPEVYQKVVRKSRNETRTCHSV